MQANHIISSYYKLSVTGCQIQCFQVTVSYYGPESED